jgi:hypothetical protein
MGRTKIATAAAITNTCVRIENLHLDRHNTGTAVSCPTMQRNKKNRRADPAGLVAADVRSAEKLRG